MYSLLPDYAYPKTIYINPDVPFEVVSGMVSANHFSFPFIVKPDIGMAGILFRKIETGNQLALYHDKLNTNYLIQEFVEMPLEIGIFYIRLPDADKGKITALFCKKFPVIQGDGISSLEQLLQKNQIPVTDETVKLSREKLQQILPENETFHLSFVGNRYHGASFHDLSDEIDESLLDVVDKLSQQANFFYGRYDIKCASIDDLKKGKNFTVL